MPRYYRIQPAGLGLRHTSESSVGEAEGLDVFLEARDLLKIDGAQPEAATRRTATDISSESRTTKRWPLHWMDEPDKVVSRRRARWIH